MQDVVDLTLSDSSDDGESSRRGGEQPLQQPLRGPQALDNNPATIKVKGEGDNNYNNDSNNNHNAKKRAREHDDATEDLVEKIKRTRLDSQGSQRPQVETSTKESSRSSQQTVAAEAFLAGAESDSHQHPATNTTTTTSPPLQESGVVHNRQNPTTTTTTTTTEGVDAREPTDSAERRESSVVSDAFPPPRATTSMQIDDSPTSTRKRPRSDQEGDSQRLSSAKPTTELATTSLAGETNTAPTTTTATARISSPHAETTAPVMFRHALLLNGAPDDGGDSNNSIFSPTPSRPANSYDDQLPSVAQDPFFHTDPHLTPCEMELLWLGEESMYALSEKEFRLDFIWQYATDELKISLRRVDREGTEAEKIGAMIRSWDPLVALRFAELRLALRKALHRGYRRPMMRRVIATLRKMPPQDPTRWERPDEDCLHRPQPYQVLARQAPTAARRIEQLDPATLRIIRIHANLRTAAENTKLKRQHIRNAILNAPHIVGGFFWRYHGDAHTPGERQTQDRSLWKRPPNAQS